MLGIKNCVKNIVRKGFHIEVYLVVRIYVIDTPPYGSINYLVNKG